VPDDDNGPSAVQPEPLRAVAPAPETADQHVNKLVKFFKQFDSTLPQNHPLLTTIGVIGLADTTLDRVQEFLNLPMQEIVQASVNACDKSLADDIRLDRVTDRRVKMMISSFLRRRYGIDAVGQSERTKAKKRRVIKNEPTLGEVIAEETGNPVPALDALLRKAEKDSSDG